MEKVPSLGIWFDILRILENIFIIVIGNQLNNVFNNITSIGVPPFPLEIFFSRVTAIVIFISPIKDLILGMRKII